MNLSVSGHHVEVTPAIRHYLRNKAEVTLHVAGKDLHCESREEGLYAAIDLLADKLDRQVLRYKDKLYEKRT